MSLEKKLEKLGLKVKVDRKAPNYHYWRFSRRSFEITISYTGTRTMYSVEGAFGDMWISARAAKNFYRSYKHYVDTGEVKW